MLNNLKDARIKNSELVNNTNKLDSQINRVSCAFNGYQLDNEANIKLLRC